MERYLCFCLKICRLAHKNAFLNNSHYFFLRPAFWARALPAADFDALLVLPSRSVFEAALAAFDDVCLAGDFLWERALPAADFDFELVFLLLRVFDALLAAFRPVTFLFATFSFPLKVNIEISLDYPVRLSDTVYIAILNTIT